MLSFGAPTFAEEECTEKKRIVFQELGLKDSKSKPQLLDCSWIRDAFTMLKSPRIPISAWEYEGGFRLTTKATSDNAKATIDFSLGIFSLSASKKSIFIASHPQFGGIGEISIPPIVASKDIEDFEVGTSVLQGFQSINNTPHVSTDWSPPSSSRRSRTWRAARRIARQRAPRPRRSSGGLRAAGPCPANQFRDGAGAGKKWCRGGSASRTALLRRRDKVRQAKRGA